MSHWLIPANIKFYEVFSAFEQAETYWPMNAKITCNDTVYIYLTAPYKQIGFVCSVSATGHSLDEAIDFVLPFIKGELRKGGAPNKFMTLKTVQSMPIDNSNFLSLKDLKQNGLNGMLMGARKLENNPGLLKYIRKNLS
jgi:hypothetical protein